MVVEIVVPLALFATLLGVIWIFAVFGQRKRHVIHETMRLAMEKGQELSPEMMRDMSMITNPRMGDLRKGVILVALALAFVLIGIVTTLNGGGDEEVFIIGVFPGMIGLAYLALWKFAYDGQAD